MKLSLKTFAARVATFSLVELIARFPAQAAGVLTLLGVGGVIAANLITPSIIPAPSAYFSESNAYGVTETVLRTNSTGAAGATFLPPTATNSVTYYFEAMVDPNLGYGTLQEPFTNLILQGYQGTSSPGQPSFYFQKDTVANNNETQWWKSNTGTVLFSNPSTAIGTSNNTGGYPFTATGCPNGRPPSGVWNGSAGSPLTLYDQGFNCGPAPTIATNTIPNLGAQQTGVTATCAASAVSGQMLVTTSLNVSPGLSPGMLYSLSAFTTSPVNVINTSFATVSVTGTGPYTLVGTAAGTCPTISSTGTALSGISSTITFPSITTAAPFSNGGSGISTAAGQHICMAMGEYGDDSPFPGAHWITGVDALTGAALPGAPALVQNLNQGTAVFTGFTTTSSNVLNVTSVTNAVTISNAVYNAGTGYVTFTVSGGSGYIPGSEFTVSGITSSGPGTFNQTYVAVAGTTQSGTTVVGNPLSGPNGFPQASALTGSSAYVSGAGALASVIMPGMAVLGTNGNTVNAFVDPYGLSSSTGTGGTGTYVLNATQTSGIGSSVFLAYGAAYHSASASGAPAWGGNVTARTQAAIGDFEGGLIGNGNNALTTFSINHFGWGGALGNFATLYGVLPHQTGFAPSTTAVASLCNKTTTIPAFAAANSMTVHWWEPLNDIGIFGDAGIAQVSGYITATAGATTGVLHLVGSPITGALTGSGTPVLSGVGIPGCSSQSACPTVTLGAGPTYTVTWASGIGNNVASIGAPITLYVGTYKPSSFIPQGAVTGYIDAAGGVPTLHVTDIPANTTFANGKFTGSLTSQWTGSLASTGILTIGTASGAVAGVGTIVNSAPGAATSFGPCTITSLITGLNNTGTYQTGCSGTTVASELMVGTGQLPAGPNALNISGLTGSGPFAGMYVTDGGVNITGQPLLITGSCGTNCGSVEGNYYQPFTADSTMVGSVTTLIPGAYIQNNAATFLTNPVKIVAYQGACGVSGAFNGGLGCYTLSTSANGNIGSAGSQQTIIFSTVSDGGAIAPGPALTINDLGPGTQYAIDLTSLSCSAIGSCTSTGTLNLSGAYDTPTLGGTPTGIQVFVSNYANSATPVAGCTPCNWGTLIGSISGGNWSGSISGIPAGGPYSVQVRASNGAAYATLPSTIKVGLLFDIWGEGQTIALTGNVGGANWSYYSGLWGVTGWKSPWSAAGNPVYVTGPVVPGTNNFVWSQSTTVAGDRFGVTGSGIPLPEGLANFEQTLGNATATSNSVTPVSLLAVARDGIGIGPMTLGNALQTQTIGAQAGSTTSWCSQAKFCTNSSGVVGLGGVLTFNEASLTGGWFTGSVSGATLTIGSSGRVGGALMPGQVLSGAGITGSPKILACLTGCAGAFGNSSTWTLDTSLGTISAESMRADVAGGSPWPNFNIQLTGTQYSLAGFGAALIQAGTFSITDTDPTTHVATTVCSDTNAFAYNQTGGLCTGAAVTSSFVNYQTGDYQVTFTSAPSSGHILTAQWTNILSPEAAVTQFNRPQGLDFVGNGGFQSGPVSSAYNQAPNGTDGHIFATPSTDESYLLQGGVTQSGYQYGAVGFSQEASWLYGTRYPNTIPNVSALTPFITLGEWRSEGAQVFIAPSYQTSGALEQFQQDMVTKSTFTGSISGGVLTLGSNAVGPMWEGEVIGGAALGSGTGIYITSRATGAFGASGSTYNLAGASGVTVTGDSLFNDVYYKGSAPTIYAGPVNDIQVQQLTGLNGTTTPSPHPTNGPAGGGRVGRRLASETYGGLTSAANSSAPIVSRANDTAAGTPSPAFDYGNTYAASATGTAALVSGVSVVTFSSGIAAHARPFVDGQWVTCSGCTPAVIMAVSLPPTQDVTRTGASQIGQSFTITLSGNLGVTGSTAITAGCHSVAGSGGSNCINVDIAQTTTNGTFGTAWAIATCGANSLNGNAANYVVPGPGGCQDTGIGEIVRTFRVGTQQSMSGLGTGSVFDDGVDLIGGIFNQSAAFTANIVGSHTVQIVKAPLLSGGVFSAVGKWVSGSTFVNYGDMTVVSGRIASILGYVGGQSFPFSSGGTGYDSGGTGVLSVQATGCLPFGTGGYAPWFDYSVVSGVIVDIYPAAATHSSQQPTGLGVGATTSVCTVTPAGGTGFNSSGSITLTLAPLEGLGGVGTMNTDNNTMGLFLYGNEGEPGNPLNSFYSNGASGYFEPGNALRPFGMFQGLAVSG